MNIDRPSILKRLLVLGMVLSLAVVVAACGSSGGSSSSSESSTTEAAPPAESEPSGEESEGEPSGEESGGETADTSEIEQIKEGELNLDMSKYCGDKPTVVGLLDGVSNTWRVQTRFMMEKLAKECPNVTEVKYSNANLNPEAFSSTISAWASQGVNVIVALDDFGQVPVPAFKAATAMGVKIGTDNAIPGSATIPTDLAAIVLPNFENQTKEWVEFLNEAQKGKAKAVLIGGPAGNLIDTPMLEDIKKAIAETGNKVELVEDEPVPGNWEPGKTQQAAAQVLNSHPDVNTVFMTYTGLAPSINRAFEAAGKPLPDIAGQSSTMEWICEINEKRKTDPEYNAFSSDGTGNLVPITFAKSMAAYQEIEAPELGPTDEPLQTNLVPVIDTLENKVPKCDKNLPPGADISHALSLEEIEEATAE